jgi:hypothetical protein
VSDRAGGASRKPVAGDLWVLILGIVLVAVGILMLTCEPLQRVVS